MQEGLRARDSRVTNAGKYGYFNHEFIVDWVRFNLPVHLRLLQSQRFYLVPDVLGEAVWGRPGLKIPDVHFAFDDGPVIVEVGKCQISKWPSMMHIDFQGNVRKVNPELSSRQIHLMADITHSLLPEELCKPMQIGLI